ncbi:MAG: N-6 DNA methylase [Deltaproteobacteria bacterium]|jgi:hypothetical protein|nr:N-6 DNA methylase [Deltaproteobacteria bacterium]
MRPLSKQLRTQLERTIAAARHEIEIAARIVLENLGVAESAPLPHLKEDELALRHKLQIHGRQLGDTQDAVVGEQKIDLLSEEVAYEHWHRMLFARFLAENNLLMYPDPETPVAISLEECEELASQEGAKNGFELAARFASRMLPQIFRIDSPVFELTFPPESTQKLERLLAELPKEIFIASDSLGWVYQFWQTARNDQINSSVVKIGSRELPLVTQNFTEPYQVNFLLDNSLGAWWAEKRLSEADLKGAIDENELRLKAALPGMPLEYLRFAKKDNGTFVPAAGTFTAWPENLCDLKIIDPCCGSGHFLVTAFLMLVPLRMELEGLSPQDAVEAVLEDNIYGLELERRCLELAAFALALTAWKYEDAGGYRPLPELNLACTGLSFGLSLEELKTNNIENKDLKNPLNKDLTTALNEMFETFKDAPLLGSLLNPNKTLKTKMMPQNELKDILEQKLSQEQNDKRQEAVFVMHGLAKALKFLAGKYHLVITNVPYLSNRKETPRLKDYCQKNYPEAHHDLATVFLERSLEFCAPGGTTSLVMPQNWLFLLAYKNLRKKLIKQNTLRFIARLGPRAFETISGEVVKTILFITSPGRSAESPDNLYGAADVGPKIHGIDVSEGKTAALKAELVKSAEIKTVSQDKQLNNPDFIIGLEERNTTSWLFEYAKSLQGIASGDNPHFRRRFWELPKISGDWVYWQSTARATLHYGGKSLALWMGEDFKNATKNKQAYVRSQESWGKSGLVIDQMGKLRSSIHTGTKHDVNCAIILPLEPKHLPAMWCFCSSALYNKEVRKINQKLNVTNSTLVKVPFELDLWTKVAQEKYPHGLPEPYSNDPTQWIFHGHPCGSVVWDEQLKQTIIGPLRVDDTVLQVAVARLLGYRWPAELDTNLHLAKEQRELLKRCESLETFTDKDGIVAIPPMRGMPSAADRLLNLLAASYGDTWSNATLSALLKKVNHTKSVNRTDKSIKTPACDTPARETPAYDTLSVESWLRDKFFAQHSRLFQNRPFIWHIWDGQKNGFAALVNYHKLDYKLLETLIYAYLGDWIRHQKNDINKKVAGAEELLAAALTLQKKLDLISIGESPYDIFVRWKPLENQASGWNPDLTDGVRLNIRPFLTVPDVSTKGAGILRDIFHIHWKKDLGRDHDSAPWYHTFQGERLNNHHLTLLQKAKER